MNRLEAERWANLLHEYASGKTVQHLSKDEPYAITGCPPFIITRWVDIDNPDFSCNISEYRIKPESQHEFKPFEKGLVREGEGMAWRCNIRGASDQLNIDIEKACDAFCKTHCPNLMSLPHATPCGCGGRIHDDCDDLHKFIRLMKGE